jgi:hypothetical protein
MKWFVICKTCGEKTRDGTPYTGDADIPAILKRRNNGVFTTER